MVLSYIEKPNCIILSISPANQDLATSDAIRISREVDPTGERTLGVLTKIDLMDKGTDAVEMLEGKSYRLKFPWVGVVNRSQADINKNADMIAARRREHEYFSTTPEYKHLAPRMGSEHLAKMLSKHLETVIKSKIPGIQSLISKTVAELEAELSRLGKPISADAGGKLRPGGDKIYNVFDNQLPAALKRLQFDKQLSMENIRKVITEADGYQPHLIAPEQGYRRLIESSVITIRGPVEAAVDAVHAILKDLVHKSVNETPELKQYPALRVEVTNAASDSFERMREERTMVLAYVNMVCASLRNSIPKSIVYCQVREAKRSFLDHFYTDLGKLETKQLSSLLNEDPAIMERRSVLAKRLELYRSAQAEIDSVAWAK
ncbi:unnamed protein product [Prunus armeniaca]